MANERERQFSALVDDLLREAQRVSPQAAVRVVAALRDSRDRILSRLAQARPGTFTAAQLSQLLDETERAMREFQRLATQETAAAQTRAFDLGERMIDEPLTRAGAMPLIVGLPRETLAVAQGYSATLLRGVTNDTLRRIDLELRGAMLGGQQPAEIVGRVSELLGGAQGRAEAIVFTEVNRMQSMSTFARQRQLNERLPGQVQNEWRHFTIGKPRPGHVALHGTVVDVNERFRNPFTGATLRFPRDQQVIPGGLAASETIHCHCRIVPKVKIPERASVGRFVSLQAAA